MPLATGYGGALWGRHGLSVRGGHCPRCIHSCCWGLLPSTITDEPAPELQQAQSAWLLPCDTLPSPADFCEAENGRQHHSS